MDQAKAPGAGADVDISEKAGRRTGVVMGWRGSREKHVGAVGAGDHQKIAMGDGVGIWGRGCRVARSDECNELGGRVRMVACDDWSVPAEEHSGGNWH